MSAVAERSPALQLAAAGLKIFPLRRNAKTPAIEGWQGQATTDPEKIAKWTGSGRNWGVCTGTERTNPDTGAREWLIALDLDLKHGKNGAAALKRACTAAGFELDVQTLIVQTPSRGGHLYYWTSAQIRQGADVLGPGSGVDVRAAGGYVVGPGSTIDGAAYQVVNDAPIAVMPPQLAALFPQGARETKPADTTPLPGVDTAKARRRALEYLKTAPVAVEGQAGDQTTYRVAAVLKDKGCTQAQALELMADFWNGRCTPAWDYEELETKVRNAFEYGKDAPGIAAPEAVFPRVDAPADDRPEQSKRAALVVTCVADVASKPIEWLWPQVFALGKHSTIAGDPGLGKSQVSIALAALVSTGGVLPDGSRCPLGDVVFITAEDDVADTIRPRLEAAGADLRRVHVIDGVPATTPSGQEGVRGFDLTSDVHRLAELLERLPDTRLIVIDPVSAFLGGTDSHKAAEVRAAMGAISKLAEVRRVALLSINHLNKGGGGGSALARVSGSGAFVAQPRAAYIVTRDKDDQALRIMAPVKNNIGDDTTAYFFKVVSVTVGGDIETSRVEWQERTEQLSADEALEQKSPKSAGAESLRAMEHLRAALAAGAKPAKEMAAAAEAAGISAATLRRARAALRVIASKETGRSNGAWVWALPEPPRTAADIFS